jgi:ribonuclease P protein component
MIPKKHRGMSSAEITEVIDNGKTTSSTYFRLFVLAHDVHVARFAVVMPHKVFRKAVERTQLKRLVFDSLVTFYVPWTMAVKIVILAKSTSKGLSGKDLQHSLSDCFKKAHLI